MSQDANFPNTRADTKLGTGPSAVTFDVEVWQNARNAGSDFWHSKIFRTCCAPISSTIWSRLIVTCLHSSSPNFEESGVAPKTGSSPEQYSFSFRIGQNA